MHHPSDTAFFGALFSTMAIVGALVLAEHLGWLRGRIGFVITLIGGIAIVVVLRITGVPPDWFSGSWEAFTIAGSLIVAGLVTSVGRGRAFGLPLFLGMGATLLVLNVLAHV